MIAKLNKNVTEKQIYEYCYNSNPTSVDFYLKSRVCCLFLTAGFVSNKCGLFRFLPELIAAAAAIPTGPTIKRNIFNILNMSLYLGNLPITGSSAVTVSYLF